MTALTTAMVLPIVIDLLAMLILVGALYYPRHRRADLVVVTSIYPARETQEDFPDITGATVADRVEGVGARYVADHVEAARALADAARPGDVLLTIGAGDVTRLGAVILERLGTRRDRSPR